MKKDKGEEKKEISEAAGERKAKKKSWKFWLVFWLLSTIFLFGWYLYLQMKFKNIENLKPLVKVATFGNKYRNDIDAALSLYQKIGGFNGKEKTILMLLQNDMELRPGGGFIGSFAIMKMREGNVSSIEVHDSGIFDGRIPEVEKMPAPMAAVFKNMSWKLRDSNWSPDFPANAEKAIYFYEIGRGEEKFDAVVGVNSNVLNSVLKVTGPVKIDGFPGEYNDENAVIQLEYQVEKGYAEQGIEKEERKSVMRLLAKSLVEKIHSLPLKEKFKLAKVLLGELKAKNIQLYFSDEEAQKIAEDMNWAGRVKPFTAGDYLMMVDANLGSLKSDYCVKRLVNYRVDFSGEKPQANLEISYDHTCRTADWMTKDYYSWLRVYVPEGAWLSEASGQKSDVTFEREFGKKVFAMPVEVKIGESKKITLSYSLPQDIKEDNYRLFLQKQSGINELPVVVMLIKSNGEKTIQEIKITSDQLIRF